MDLSKLVIEYKFDFLKIAEVIGMSEHDVREMWTEIHIKRKKSYLRKKAASPEPNKRIILSLEPKRKFRKPFEDVVKYFHSVKSQKSKHPGWVQTNQRKTFDSKKHKFDAFLPEIKLDQNPLVKSNMKSEIECFAPIRYIEQSPVVRKKVIVLPQKQQKSTKSVVVRQYKENICVCVIKAHIFIPFLQIIASHNLEILHGRLGELTTKVLLRLDELQNSGATTHRSEARSRKFINYMKGHTYSILVHGAEVIKIMHNELPHIPQNAYYHCSASQRHAMLERGLLKEEESNKPQQNKFELVCVVVPCPYIAAEFYPDFFQFVFNLKFDIFKFKVESFNEKVIQDYCLIANRFPEELSESLLVVALEAQNAFEKTKNIKKEFPWLLVSQSAEKAAQEVTLFFF